MDIQQTNLEKLEEEELKDKEEKSTLDGEDIHKGEEDITEEDKNSLDEAEEETHKMTPEELIEKWKSLYNRIYLSVYDDQEFVWHKINRQEYAQIMDSVDETDTPIDEVVEQRQTLTLQYALLSPDKEYLPDILEEYPGILTSLTAEILKKSGFSKPLTVEI